MDCGAILLVEVFCGWLIDNLLINWGDNYWSSFEDFWIVDDYLNIGGEGGVYLTYLWHNISVV